MESTDSNSGYMVVEDKRFNALAWYGPYNKSDAETLAKRFDGEVVPVAEIKNFRGLTKRSGSTLGGEAPAIF